MRHVTVRFQPPKQISRYNARRIAGENYAMWFATTGERVMAVLASCYVCIFAYPTSLSLQSRKLKFK